MKYFTEELIADLNSGNLQVMKAAEKQWERNALAYEKYISKISSHMPPKLARFAKKISLHDSLLLECGFISYPFKIGTSKPKKHTCFCLKCLDAKEDCVHILTFSHIRDCRQYFCCDDSKKNEAEYLQCAYDEITLLDNAWFRFEMWVFPNHTLKLEFKEFNYKKERVRA